MKEVIEMNKSKQMSENFWLGMILACVGGFLDVYTYICRGGVFANAQTGNIVLFGIKMAQGEFYKSLYYLIPIIAFVVGILTAEIIKKKYKNNTRFHWRQIIIVFEMIVLAGISFLPQGNLQNMFANVMVSFVCSLQVESFRKFNGNAMATTMCTGNLRSATECLYKYTNSKDKSQLQSSLQYFGIILFFIIGATIGTVLSNVIGVQTILFSCLGLGVVFILMFIQKE